jgi:hypothetical protein
MVQVADQHWQLPADQPAIPLSMTVLATLPEG